MPPFFSKVLTLHIHQLEIYQGLSMKIKAIVYGVSLAVGLSALTACQTTNPYTGEQQTSKATSGAVIGGIAGALLGAATSSKKDRKKGALIGAGVGAVAGGSVGYYMDTQEAKLRDKLRGSGVSVTRNGNNIILNMPGNITFASGSADLNAQFYNVLDSVVLVLQEYKSTLVNVEGHTDSTGSDQLNQDLSQRRAVSVASYLTSHGVANQRLAAMGYGKTRPIADNGTPAGRAVNRRVEIILEPITE